MKKWFTCVTSAIYVLFFCLILQESPDAMLFEMYPSVMVLSYPQETNVDQLQSDLNKLGRESNSLIALRIAQPTKEEGKTSRFTYVLYGMGELPKGFVEAGPKEKTVLDPANSYLIVDGSLSLDKLASTLQNYGAEAYYYPGENSLLRISLGYVPRPSLSFSLILFSLLFIVLIAMQRIQRLRASGIRVLSGIGRGELFQRAFMDDLIAILFGYAVAFATSTMFLFLNQLVYRKFLLFLLTCAGVYSMILVLLALLMELLFWRILKKSHLVDLIKGKMPIKAVLTVLLVGQLIAYLSVGFGAHMLTIVYPFYQTMNAGMEEWSRRPEHFHFSMNIGAFDPYDKTEQNQRDLAWYDATVEAMEDPNVIYCEHFLRETDFMLPTLDASRKILIVSPSYLKKEDLLSDAQELIKMENLQEGQFGLILPKESTSDEKREAEQALRTYVFERYWGKDSNQSVDAIESVRVESARNDPLFIYNYDGKPPTQFLTDPYVVVLTPQSTGHGLRSTQAWSSRIDACLFFPSYDAIEALIQKHGVSPFVSHIQNARAEYVEEIADYRFEMLSLLIGSIIGMGTAFVSFIVMNRLYFEHFRREIFIRRISGVSFFENHATYLKIQGIMMVAAWCLLFILSRKFWLNFSMFLLFLLMEVVILYRQMKRESRGAVTLLKGE